MKRIFDARQLPAYISVEQYAQLMGLNVVTVRLHCRQGKIPAMHVGKLWRIDKNKALDKMNRGCLI